jgi:hypothetical protein
MNNPGGFQPSVRISNRVTAALTRIERARANAVNVPAATFDGAASR